MTRGTFVVLGAMLGLVLFAAPLAAQEAEFKDGQWVNLPAPAQGTPEGELSLVRHYMDRGQYGSAVSAADRYLKLYNDPNSREEVMLLAGESEVKRGRLFQGYERFEKQLAEYSGGRFADRATEHEFDVADDFLAGRKRVVWGFIYLPARDEGLDILSRIAERSPGTPVAERAMLRIAADRYARGEWTESADAYDHYVNLFAKGNKTDEAMLKGAEATYRSFTGVAYDETPLIEAEQRYRDFAQRFPISAKQADVDATLEQIRATRAHKLLEEGRFYARTDKPQAAAYTYKLVIDMYPQTDAAEQARAALEGLPSKQAVIPSPPPEPPRPPAPTTQAAAPPVIVERSSPRTTRPAALSKEAEKIINLEELPTSAPSGEGR
ncbi:MAG: outer membrane protein assembly factor BamD [Phycisphaerae bacterium]|jgi:outer membrane protein assembly factor BamD (BamD/ComL family)